MEEIKIYTNETCNFCKELKTSLDEKEIKYTNIDTSKNKEEWQKVVDTTFIPTVPTVLYKDTYFVAGRDFNNAHHLESVLSSFNGFDYDDPRLLLERLRTLTFSITMAFQRMDGILKQIETKINTNEHKSTD
tara:strand:- start:137 stop:532 length:396 start_codon:yes stop_codon:yes gene_type:complete